MTANSVIVHLCGKDAENRALLGDDWWPYGVERNRPAIDTFLCYHLEQGHSERLFTRKDIFVPELMGT